MTGRICLIWALKDELEFAMERVEEGNIGKEKSSSRGWLD